MLQPFVSDLVTAAEMQILERIGESDQMFQAVISNFIAGSEIEMLERRHRGELKEAVVGDFRAE